jgi:hypothetical protein
VVGLEFYQKENRVTLEITQAKLDKAGGIDASSKTKKFNPDLGTNYLSLPATCGSVASGFSIL